MSVDSKQLLQDLRRQVKRLEDDLRAQARALPDLGASLREEYERGRAAERIGDAFEVWRDEQVTQAAVHWVQSTARLSGEEDATTLTVDREEVVARWWTFAGHRYNAAAAALIEEHGCTCSFDGFAVTIRQAVGADTLPERLIGMAARLAETGGVSYSDEALDGIKFRDCVPAGFLDEMVRSRANPAVEAVAVAEKRVDVRMRSREDE